MIIAICAYLMLGVLFACRDEKIAREMEVPFNMWFFIGDIIWWLPGDILMSFEVLTDPPLDRTR